MFILEVTGSIEWSSLGRRIHIKRFHSCLRLCLGTIFRLQHMNGMFSQDMGACWCQSTEAKPIVGELVMFVGVNSTEKDAIQCEICTYSMGAP